jgi:hypothetical protein
MGKKNKYNKLGYFGKAEADDKLAKKYGINKDDYTQERAGGGRYDFVNDDAYKKAIARAAANDYDTRRSIEAAQLSGNKKAKKLGKGISNMSEAYAAERFMEKTHKNRMGNGGKYDSANDEGGVTSYWVNKDRDKLRDEFKNNSKEKDEKRNDVFAPYDEDYQISQHFDGVLDRLNSRPPKLYEAQQDEIGVDNDSDEAAKLFTRKYAADVTRGLGIKEDRKLNLQNAMYTAPAFGKFHDPA